jgi:4-hydroxy-2-oxoheptanedioate aldolase
MTDKVREAVKAGRPSFACWMTLADPLAAEAMGRAGYDSVILDAQHGGVTWDNLLGALQALDLGGTRAFVRVGGVDPAQIMRAMDLGALGVIVPMVSTAEQARISAQAIRYPPHGIRSFGMVRNYYSVQPMAFEPLCMVMIETAEALLNLDEIAATPGVDGLFVGPMDLALSLGLKPTMEMPAAVLDAIARVVAACRKHGKISGSASLGLPNAQALIEHGVQYIAQGNDLAFLRKAAANELEQLRSFKFVHGT